MCSRRAGEALIARGEVLVNGVPAKLGQKVVAGVDQVVVRGQAAAAENQARVTVAVNKPRGLICSNDDPHNARTVFSLVPPEFSSLRFFCAGRLDKDSEGLVILTTDGDLAHRLMHPSNEVVKHYAVTLRQPFPPSLMDQLVEGVLVEGEHFKVEHAALVSSDGSSRDLEVRMHHGKKREIRQLFRALGYDVIRLQRTQIGGLRVAGIAAGDGRALSPREIELLFVTPPAKPAR